MSFQRFIEYKIVLVCLLFGFITKSIAQVGWVGNVDQDFYNVDNWDDSSVDFLNLQATTLIINAGNPYDPIQNGGSAGDINRRPGPLDIANGGKFTVQGALLPWSSNYINGQLIINEPGYLNIRSFVFIGNNSNGSLEVNGGRFESKNALFVGRGASGNGSVSILGGICYVGATLEVGSDETTTVGTVLIDGGRLEVASDVRIGDNGKITINGIGALVVNGDNQTALQNLVDTGKIVTDEDTALEVNFDGSQTIVAIPRDENRMVQEYATYILLKNEFVEAKIDKSSSDLLSLVINGTETLSQSGRRIGGYYDFQTSYGFERITGTSFSIKEETEDYVDISFLRTYEPGVRNTPADADIHYVLKKGDTGLYTYSVIHHKAEYPSFDLGSWRQVLWTAHEDGIFQFENIYVDAIKNWQMASYADNENAEPTTIPEIIKLVTGVRAGMYDGKYQYTEELMELPAWGFTSDKNKMGLWAVMGSHEFYNSGPTHHDLNSAAGIIHVLLNGLHYNSRGMVIPEGRDWNKVYGPYLIYMSSGETAETNWHDAKARAAQEKAAWPYSWLTNTPEYPLQDARGAVAGNFNIIDVEKDNVNGANAWVGVTQLSSRSDGDWQFEEENYQYWTRADDDGNFLIEDIRPGDYTLFAFNDGAIQEFKKENIRVEASNVTQLGNLELEIPRNNGNLIWEIGVPNRTAEEFVLGHLRYSEGFIQENFHELFPETIEYNVADNNWDEVLPYVHSSYFDANDNRSRWDWNINFEIQGEIPNLGNATLTIAYASTDHAQQWLYINGESSPSITFYPPNGGGNAFLRQSDHAKYAVQTVEIPYSKLREGMNTIKFVMPSTSSGVNHHMYDYISFEGEFESVLSVEDHKVRAKRVSLFPNPATNFTTINMEADVYLEKPELALFTLNGKKVVEDKNPERIAGKLKLYWNQDLTTGVYILRIKDGTVTRYKKLFIK